MTYNGISGVNEFTPQEIGEKEEAMVAPRAIVSAARKIHADQYILSAPDFKNTTEAFTYQTAALNAVLAWLNAPQKIRPFLDALIVICGASNSKSFTATNLEIGKQMRVGRFAKEESIQKNISRWKKKMFEWQNDLNFDLIGIERGKFDPVRRKNEPTRYTPYILEWIPQIVHLASSYRNWVKGSNLKLKEIRRAARDFLNSLDRCPPLRGHLPKTLSEEEKVDRRVNLIVNSHRKNLDFLNSLEIDSAELHAYIVRRLDEAYLMKRGLVGNLLHKVSRDISVVHKLKAGSLLDEADPFEPEEIPTAPRVRFWADGGWIENSDQIEVKTETNQIENRAELSAGHFSESASDNIQNGEKTVCKPLIPLRHDGTLFDNIGRTVLGENEANIERTKPLDEPFIGRTKLDEESEPFDWFNDEITPVTIQNYFETWLDKVRELIPDKSPGELWRGAWQVYLDTTFATPAQMKSKEKMENIGLDVLTGRASLEELREAFVDWTMLGVSYHQKGATILQTPQKLAVFRAKLIPYLEIENNG